METNRKRQVTLQSGEALPVDLPRGARLYLTQGELVLQAPARWLAGTVVLSPARRVAAPAMLAPAEIQAATALTTATFLVEAQPGMVQRIGMALDRLRGAGPRSPQPARG
jgi:hypothetical protein